MRILFVCTGNTCRSPLAEAIVKRMVSDAGRTDVEVSSAGVQAHNGSPASDEALLVGLERNLDISGHRSRLLTRAIVEESDLILAMSESHVSRVRDFSHNANVHLVTAFGSIDEPGRAIQDPYGGDLAAYRRTADDLEHELSGVLTRIAG